MFPIKNNLFLVADVNNWAGELEKAKNDFNLDSYTKQWMDECERVNGTEAIEEIRVSLLHYFLTISKKSYLLSKVK